MSPWLTSIAYVIGVLVGYWFGRWQVNNILNDYLARIDALEAEVRNGSR